jgi:CRISP-associated protein Cas1
MGYSQAALNLRRPAVVDLPRLSDRITFLYLDMVRVVQEDTGVTAWDESGAAIPVPSAGLSVLLLGPGSSITSPAASTLFRNGTTLIYAGSGGSAFSPTPRPLTARAQWAQAQARMWASPENRRQVARTLFARRFPALEWPDTAPISMMRGLEGSEVRRAYKAAAKKAGLSGWRRETDTTKAADPVNPLPNLANSILYGAALAACSALGLNPALGAIHQGAASALLFDLADMHKTRSSIPLAFSAAGAVDAPARVRRGMRDYLIKNKVLQRDIELLVEILTPFLEEDPGDVLLDDGDHPVPAGKNFGL